MAGLAFGAGVFVGLDWGLGVWVDRGVLVILGRGVEVALLVGRGVLGRGVAFFWGLGLDGAGVDRLKDPPLDFPPELFATAEEESAKLNELGRGTIVQKLRVIKPKILLEAIVLRVLFSVRCWSVI